MAQELDKWQMDGIYRGFMEGKSQREISAIVGCSLPTVNAHIQKLKKQQSEKPKTKEIQPTVVKQVNINLETLPTTETVKTDILIVYRRSLYELNKRLPEMTDEQVYQLSMQLLNQLNNGNTEH